jgi:glycosyltransferase AglD
MFSSQIMKSFLIVIPAHNEEKIIRYKINTVLNYLNGKNLGVNWRILVAENGSRDKTIKELEKIPKSKHFSYVSLPVRSRSKALLAAWLSNDADYYMFMDADLSTDIKHIPELVKYLNKDYDIVIGSRRLKNSEVKRLFFRKVLSSCFHFLMKLIFGLKIQDYQCGFKAFNRKIKEHILPQLKYTDEGFLDTEMMVVANSKGYTIKEIPVKWYDTRPSKFKIHRSIYMNLLNSFRIKRDLILGKYK